MCRRRDDAFSPRFFAKTSSFDSASQSRRSSPSFTRIDWSGFAHANSNEEHRKIMIIEFVIFSPSKLTVSDPNA